MTWRTLIAQALAEMRTRPVIWLFSLGATLLNLGMFWLYEALFPFMGDPANAAPFPPQKMVLYLALMVVQTYVGLLLLAAVVYQVRENMAWQRSVAEAVRRGGALLLISLLVGIWVPLFAGYLYVLALLPSNTAISAFVGPLYLLFFVGMMVVMLFFPWMTQACIQERLSAIEAIRRGWSAGMNRLRTVFTYVTVVSTVYIVVWGGVYGLLALVQGWSIDWQWFLSLFQPFPGRHSGGAVTLVLYSVVSTVLGLFSWVLEALVWVYLLRGERSEVGDGYQVVGIR